MNTIRFNWLLARYKYDREAVTELYEFYYSVIVRYINRQFRGAVDGQDVALTNKEFELLCLLLDNQGLVLTRQVLMDRVWGFEAERENRTLDVHIRTLRVKLGAAGSLIETIRGVGYKLGSGT